MLADSLASKIVQGNLSMTNNRQQFITPETRPEYARIPTLSLAIDKILDVLDRTYNIGQFIADKEVVEVTQERPFVLKAIDYTIKSPIAELAEAPNDAVSFPSSEQHYMLIDAEKNVENALNEMAA